MDPKKKKKKTGDRRAVLVSVRECSAKDKLK